MIARVLICILLSSFAFIASLSFALLQNSDPFINNIIKRRNANTQKIYSSRPNELQTPINEKTLATETVTKALTRVSTACTALLLPQLWGLKPSIADDKPKKQKKIKVLETDLGIKYIVLKQGQGAFPAPGDFVVISYTAFLNNGTVFDTTDAKGRKPITFRIGKKQMIPGVESVVEYMQPGTEVTCTIPSKYAYGEKGVCLPDNSGCLVPPNEDLKYAIKLISVGAGYN